MKAIALLIALSIISASCKKSSNEPDTPPASSTCGGRYDKESFSSVKTSPDIQYGIALNIAGAQEQLFMDVYEPNSDTAQKRALIIFVHGGAWTSGTKRQGLEFCTLFAKKGYVTASIDYRLGIEMPVNDKTRGEAVYRGVQDIKAAIRYARANAAFFKIDTSQIFIGGYSAGATNAVHAAYWNESEVPQNIDKIRWGTLEGNGGNQSFSSYVQAVYGIAGSIVDVNWMQNGEPPAAFVHSKTDNTVPYNSGIDGKGIFVYGGAAIVQKAISANIPATLYTYENIAHGDYLQPANFTSTTNAVSSFLFSRIKCQ